MRIVVINPILYTNETANIKKVKSIKDTMIYHLCLEMKNQGHTPILITAEDYKPILNEEYPFQILFLKTTLKKIFRPNCFPYLSNLKTVLKKINFDFLISSEVFSMNSLYVSMHYKRKTIIWHELAKHNRMMKKIPSKIWYNIIARLCFRNTRIVARSENAKKFIKNYCNNVSNTIIDHGVDLEEFTFSLEKDKQFIVVSQLIKRKHIEGIIKSFSDFIIKNKNYKLIIIGSGVEENRLKKMRDELQLTKQIVFKGQLTHKEIIPILAKSKALIINTEKDNNMLSIVESIATCTPIITTPVPYNCSYIMKNDLGIITTKLKAEDYIKMIEKNDSFVNNCYNYREKVSNTYHVKQFIQEGNRVINNDLSEEL